MLKRLVVLSAFSLGGALAAPAATINGYFSANGTDMFTSSSITFQNAQVAGAIGGTFATYLTDGNPIVFLGGSLPYSQGFNVAPGGSVPLFTVTENGEMFTFMLTDYTAGYITNGSNGCAVGGACLDATGDGFYVGSGVLNGTSSAAVFTFTSQYVPGQPQSTFTTFSASTSVTPAGVPEPAPLALVGIGLLGMCGFVRRKCLA
jgi:hypothetical protein